MANSFLIFFFLHLLGRPFCRSLIAWESASVKTWEILWLRGSTGSVTGNYLERRQQQTELRSNDIVLIQEHNQRIFYKARLFKPKTQL